MDFFFLTSELGFSYIQQSPIHLNSLSCSCFNKSLYAQSTNIIAMQFFVKELSNIKQVIAQISRPEKDNHVEQKLYSFKSDRFSKRAPSVWVSNCDRL